MPRLTDGWKRRPPLYGPSEAAELDPETAVDVDVAGVVRPRDPEDQLTLGLADALDDPGVHELGAPGQHRAEGFEDFPYRLVELLLALVAAEDLRVQRLDDAVPGFSESRGLGGGKHLIKTFRGGIRSKALPPG